MITLKTERVQCNVKGKRQKLPLILLIFFNNSETDARLKIAKTLFCTAAANIFV